MIYAFPHVSKSEFKFVTAEAAQVFVETDDSRFGLIGSEAIMV
jgi:hypothetical protein